jgi:non-heme chloroperoxidase
MNSGGGRRRALLGAAGALLTGRGWGQPAPADGGSGGCVRSVVRTSDGVGLSVLDSGPGKDAGATPLVFLPGWCMPATIWRVQLEAFGGRRRVVAIDPRGQGESEVPAGGYDADRRADDLHDVLQALRLGRPAVLVAWSLAVLESLQYVQRHGSGELAGLVLVDNSIGEPPAPRAAGNLPGELRAARAATVARFVRSMFAHPPPEALVAELIESALRMPLEASIALLSYPLPREHWREIVLAFDRPLAYLVTARFREQALNLEKERPQARIEVFEHAGHALFVDAAERFDGVLGEWVGRLS